MEAEVELGLGSVVHGLRPHLIEANCVGSGPLLVLEPLEGRASPQGERLGEQLERAGGGQAGIGGFAHEGLEAAGVDSQRVDAQGVATAAHHDRIGPAEQRPKPGDVDADRLARIDGQLAIGPHSCDERVVAPGRPGL